VRLTHFNAEARAWAEFIVNNVEISGNSSAVPVKFLILIDAICAGEPVDLGVLLRDGIQNVAEKQAPRITLGHCSFLTAYMVSKGVPVVPGDGTVKPKGALTMKWLTNTLKSDAQFAGQGQTDDLDDEIDQFDIDQLNVDPADFDIGQPDMEAFPGPHHTPEVVPNQHSVNEIARLLTQLDIATALRLPHNYYEQNSSLYREAMTHRQQFYHQPFYPLYATMDDMQTRWELQNTDLRVAQMREREAWFAQYSDWQARQEAVQRSLFGDDSPGLGGPSCGESSMPPPHAPGDDQQ
jgi:hypothetical protein